MCARSTKSTKPHRGLTKQTDKGGGIKVASLPRRLNWPLDKRQCMKKEQRNALTVLYVDF